MVIRDITLLTTDMDARLWSIPDSNQVHLHHQDGRALMGRNVTVGCRWCSDG